MGIARLGHMRFPALIFTMKQEQAAVEGSKSTISGMVG